MSILNITGVSSPIMLLTLMSSISNKKNTKTQNENSAAKPVNNNALNKTPSGAVSKNNSINNNSQKTLPQNKTPDKEDTSAKTEKKETNKKDASGKTEQKEHNEKVASTKKEQDKKASSNGTEQKNQNKKAISGETEQKEPTKKVDNNKKSDDIKAGDDMKPSNKKTMAVNNIKKTTQINKKPIQSAGEKPEKKLPQDINNIQLNSELIDQCNNLEISEIGKLLISSSALLQCNLANYLKAETKKIEKLLDYLDENKDKELTREELIEFKTSVMESMHSLGEIEAQLNKKIKTGLDLIKMHSHKYDFNESSDDD